MEPDQSKTFHTLDRVWCFWLSLTVTWAGCASTRLTDTKRAGVEQLLVSKAIDISLDKIDFDCLTGAAVFVNEKYLECSDSKYIVGAVRQRAFEAGCRVVDKPDQADIVLELYSGAVGTDRSEGFIGLPAFSLPGPVPVQLPEIKLFSQTSQYGTAKLGMVAYDAKSKQALSSGGLTRARSSDSNWTVLGIGPFKSGSLREEYKLTEKLESPDQRLVLSSVPAPESQPQYAGYPAPSIDSPPSEMFVPGSLQARTYQSEKTSEVGGHLKLSRLPWWKASDSNATPDRHATSQ